ncbi:hypothetical protein [Pseudoalteromonas piscicida]|uniref:hypothetical protein n=1 Tax=Pseudoalteromonas piscicida TaxID=43662 RepID=UPI001C97763A|nr:hypothetical protein [Pseudoalteromonas piscicida]QZO12607.1 hypothetical protein K5642_16220 [Pseudoalteromonas piscicida]
MKEHFITYYASSETMGDTPEEHCEAFREWALKELEKEYPDYEVEVSSENSIKTFSTSDMENEQDIDGFVRNLWDKCPWDFIDE